MELKELFLSPIFKVKTQLLLLLVGIGLGIVVYSYPFSYSASGSFFVVRKADENKPAYFSYEGYYSQQTAQAYTNSFIGLIESVDIRSAALKTLNIEVNEQTLRKYGKLIKAKKSGPQIIDLTTQGFTPKESEALWNATTTAMFNSLAEIKKTGDANLNIIRLSEKPVLKEPYKPLWLIGLGSILAIEFVTIFSYALYSYIKHENQS